MLDAITDNAIVRSRLRPATRLGHAAHVPRDPAMQRLTELYESRRYGRSMANPRLSAFAGSPMPMQPRATVRTFGTSLGMRSWLIEEGLGTSESGVRVTHVISI